MKKRLEELTEKEFDTLKSMGLLWEIYPEAPEFFYQIKSNHINPDLPDWGWSD